MKRIYLSALAVILFALLMAPSAHAINKVLFVCSEAANTLNGTLGAPMEGNRLVIARLQAMGATVTVIGDTDPARTTAHIGQDVVVIFSNSSAQSVNGTNISANPTYYNQAGIGIISNNPSNWDNLGLSTSNGAVNNNADGLHLNITDPASPLAAKKTATVDIFTTNTYDVFSGTPQGPSYNATVYATGIHNVAYLGDTPASCTIAALDIGETDQGRSVACLERRVGFGSLRINDPKLATENAWQLFAAAVRWASKEQVGNVLLVRATGSISAADAALKARLERNGYYVVDKASPAQTDPAAVTAADATGMKLVVVSESISSSSIVPGAGAGPTVFNAVTVPVLLMEVGDADNMNMTGAAADDFGPVAGQDTLTKSIHLVNPNPLPVNIPDNWTNFATYGDIDLVNTVPTVLADGLGWIKPSAMAPSGRVVATVVDVPSANVQNACVLFPAGAALLNSTTAPAKRATFPFRGVSAVNANEIGWQLFDDVCEWLVYRPTTVIGSGREVLLAAGGPIGNPVVWGYPMDRNTYRDLVSMNLNPWVFICSDNYGDYPSGGGDLKSSVATGKDVILISETAAWPATQTAWNINKPIIGLRATAGYTLQLCGGDQNNTGATVSSIYITDATHWLAAGLPAGATTIMAAGGWTNRTKDTVTKPAYIQGVGAVSSTAIWPSIYGVEAGVTNFNGDTIPQRRAVNTYFARYPVTQMLPAYRSRLLEAAIFWVTSATVPVEASDFQVE